MSEFVELLVGTFANKRQAQSHPTRYAHIRVSHRLLGENRIYGEQAYNYLLNRPYRQFVIDVVEKGEEYHLRNYEIANPLQRQLQIDDMVCLTGSCMLALRKYDSLQVNDEKHGCVHNE